MNILIFFPTTSVFTYSWYAGDPIVQQIRGQVAPVLEPEQFSPWLQKISKEVASQTGYKDPSPEIIAIHVPFGGDKMAAEELLRPEIDAALCNLKYVDPLHIPGILTLVESIRSCYPRMPVYLINESAFFHNLPERERYYSIKMELMKTMSLQRYGFHGIYHRAACRALRHKLLKNNGYSTPKILSICLEPKPEVVAVIGTKPVYISGGVTPLAGIPGKTSSGEIDPGIVLNLAEKRWWGPERINHILTQESGLKALADCSVSLDDVLKPHSDFPLVKKVIRYRFLLAVGKGIAAMGGITGIVFSGRNASIGKYLGPWLLEKIQTAFYNESTADWTCFETCRDQIIAERVAALYHSGRLEPEREETTPV